MIEAHVNLEDVDVLTEVVRQYRRDPADVDVHKRMADNLVAMAELTRRLIRWRVRILERDAHRRAQDAERAAK